MLAIVCPGQGSQSPGMLAAWSHDPATAAALAAWSEAAGVDLLTHGTTSDADTIRDTAIAQPLLVAAAIASWRALLAKVDPTGVWLPDVTAGHSVGELTAAAVAGVLTDTDAVRLVALRGRAMAAAAAAGGATGMSAVLGGNHDEVVAAITAAGLVPANVNGGGQIVAAGTLEALAAFAAAPPARARIVPLTVAGAFHTSVMAPAEAEFSAACAATTAADPRTRLVSNADGRAYGELAAGSAGFGVGVTVMARLAAQVVAPVRWDLCQQTFADLGVTAVIELAPGGVLAGLARRTLPGVERVAITSPDDIDAAADLIARHGVERTAQEISS